MGLTCFIFRFLRRSHNALRQNLSTDGRAPEWPKVVISNLQIPADQMTLTRSLTLKASDCIHFDAVLWHDAKRSERFSNLSLCAPELPKQSNNFVLTWKSFSISGKTSGQVRSDGPTPPYSKLPSDPAMERWLMNQFGLYYIGSLLTLVGYDPNFTVGSTPKPRTVVKGWKTSDPAWRLFAASSGCGTARCIRTHQPLLHRVSGMSCGRPARA